jgi:hypothetical protein
MTAPEAQRAPQMEPAPGLLFPPELLVSGAPSFAFSCAFRSPEAAGSRMKDVARARGNATRCSCATSRVARKSAGDPLLCVCQRCEASGRGGCHHIHITRSSKSLRR